MSLGGLVAQLLPALGPVLARSGMPIRETLRGLIVEVAVALAAAAVAATGIGFGIAACYMALARSVGAPGAAAIVALGLLVIAGLMALVVSMLSARRSRRAAVARLAAQQAAAADPMAKLAGQVGANPLRSLLVAAVAGAITGWLDRRI